MVEGMTCTGCERAVQKTIEKMEGVQKATANLSMATVSIEYDPQKVNIGEIKSAINNIGYKLVDERPPLGQREGSDEAIP